MKTSNATDGANYHLITNLTFMKPTILLLILLTASLGIYGCFSNDTVESTEPDFADGGKTIDSLKKAYDCESIRYENWSHKKPEDSCLTVCLINSTRVPSGYKADETVNQLKSIAGSIKKALTKPQLYKSFYIVFLKKEKNIWHELSIHSAGGEIPVTEL